MKPGTLLAVTIMKGFSLVEEAIQGLKGNGVDVSKLEKAVDDFREGIFDVGEELPGFDPMMECLSGGDC